MDDDQLNHEYWYFINANFYHHDNITAKDF